MKDKWRQWIRKLWGEELFRRTRNRLTLVYSGLLILFLTVFIIIVYGVLHYIIMNDQNRVLQALADREQRLVQEYIRQNKTLIPRDMEIQGLLGTSEDHLFTYIIGTNGQLLYGVDASSGMRGELLRFMGDWSPGREESKQVTVQVRTDDRGDRRGPRGYQRPMDSAQTNTQEFRVLMAGRPLMLGNTQVGMIYVGTNISYHTELFNWLLLVFGGLALLFFGFALVMSRHMSKRAMVPVQLSYQRQREFVADASHELRTPLSVMLSTINALELEQSEETDPFTRKLMANMRDEVKRMSGLVSDLLLLARSDSPEYSFRMETFDYEPHARQIVEAMRPVAAAKGVKLDYVPTDELPITGDLERLKQLLYILLDNAVKYTLDGGEILVNLSLSGHEPARKLQLIVKDSGIGIAPEDQTRIFDRFYRADKSRTRQAGGHGLGLSIARWIVDAHQGSIKVTSVPGEGSCFIVSLPA